MTNSITIVIPNRNRDLRTVERSLASIVPQLDRNHRLVVVDYGSHLSYQKELQQLLEKFASIELILCPTQGQLWNKSRCINIVLKTCSTSHFMVSDMDMIWHPQFLKNQLNSFSLNESVYYTVGVMTEEESKLDKPFEELAVKFQTNDEATGITVFPTEHLKFINGFDEFYHGWGSEDTDAHVRLRHAGYGVRFRESEILFKHQWHAKTYRSKNSTAPFHPSLEQINHSYLSLSKTSKKIKTNENKSWGKACDSAHYEQLAQPSLKISKHATGPDIKALFHFMNDLPGSEILEVSITTHPEFKALKTGVKKVIGKKTPDFMPLDEANRLLLEAIVMNHHNCAYRYNYDSSTSEIHFSINLNR